MKTLFVTPYGEFEAKIENYCFRPNTTLTGKIVIENVEYDVRIYLGLNHNNIWVHSSADCGFADVADLSRIIGDSHVHTSELVSIDIVSKVTVIQKIYDAWVIYITKNPDVLKNVKIEGLLIKIKVQLHKLDHVTGRDVEDELSTLYKQLHDLGYEGKYSNKPFWKINLVGWLSEDPSKMTRDELLNAIYTGSMLIVRDNTRRPIMVPDSCLDTHPDWDDKAAFSWIGSRQNPDTPDSD